MHLGIFVTIQKEKCRTQMKTGQRNFKTKVVYKKHFRSSSPIQNVKHENKNWVIPTLQQITLKNILKTGAKNAHAHCIHSSCKAVFPVHICHEKKYLVQRGLKFSPNVHTTCAALRRPSQMAMKSPGIHLRPTESTLSCSNGWTRLCATLCKAYCNKQSPAKLRCHTGELQATTIEQNETTCLHLTKWICTAVCAASTFR